MHSHRSRHICTDLDDAIDQGICTDPDRHTDLDKRDKRTDPDLFTDLVTCTDHSPTGV